MKLGLFNLLLLISLFTQAQQRVALQSNGTSSIFSGSNPFLAAYNAAVTGDTIYLPGGNLPFPSIIDKGLVIIGAGHHPDSSSVTNRTILNGNLTISENADGLHLEGIYLTGTLNSSNNHKIDNIVIKRCRLGSFNFNGNRSTPCVNLSIIESVLDGSLYFDNTESVIISNSILGGRLFNPGELGLMNSVLLYNSTSSSTTSAVIYNSSNSYYSNNVFMRNSYAHYVHYISILNTFSHNVFRTEPDEGSNTFTTNYLNVDLNNFFVDQTGFVFNYNDDLQLLDPTTYLGNDGAEVGLYGGVSPLKSGFVPQNPHFQSKTIAGQTNASGELEIQLTIEAQND